MFLLLARFPHRIFRKFLCIKQKLELRKEGERLNSHIDYGKGRFVICSPGIKVILKKGKEARLVLHGDVLIRSDLGGNRPIILTIGSRGLLKIHGEFIIGDGVTILISENAQLSIGGRKSESGSGITCDTKLIVTQKIEIGFDFICAWDVFITDSDHHQIIGQSASLPVSIGNHVWIAYGATVLKGSEIADGCIVAAKSMVHRQTFPRNSLIAGIPAKLARKSVEWSRDIVKQ
jgi:acetyltransferase-like isoleucine patch superfamily enzyme